MSITNSSILKALQYIDSYPGRKLFLLGPSSLSKLVVSLLKQDEEHLALDCFKEDLSSFSFRDTDVLIDCVYDRDFTGSLPSSIAALFHTWNGLKNRRISLDINSGAEACMDHYDTYSFVSEVTIVLDTVFPFHHLKKDHHLFTSLYYCTEHEEIDENWFFSHFPKKPENAYKGTYGHIGFVSGSYGMAGACSLNILGAKTLGAGYIDVCCTHDIYPVLSSQHITSVFHPYNEHDFDSQVLPVLCGLKAIAFGSGCKNVPQKERIFDSILQNAVCPVVLDAEGLRLLEHNYYVLRFIQQPVILTPHIGEFADILNITVFELQKNKIALCRKFSKDYQVYIVLKGPATIITSPEGEVYINESGNEGLAQAGSGDLLTGMITAMLSYQKSIFLALEMAVYLHGHLADLLCRSHAKQTMNLLDFPSAMDTVFKKHGY